MLKKYFSNPAIYFLLAGNIYCIWYYQNHPNAFATIVWIYWFQSITIGFFTFLDLLTIKNADPSNFTLNDKQAISSNKGCAAWFFLVHFGAFHFVYGIFLLVDFGVRPVNKLVFLLGIASFFLESILNFIRQKQIERTQSIQLGQIFFLPYLRIIPMHLMILLPAFLGWKPSILFLVLKMGADILSFLAYQYINGKNKMADSSI
jgi:hypothetical protein